MNWWADLFGSAARPAFAGAVFIGFRWKKTGDFHSRFVPKKRGHRGIDAANVNGFFNFIYHCPTKMGNYFANHGFWARSGLHV